MATRKTSTAKAPWKRPRPKKAKHTKLSGKSKRAARSRARKSGRRYPNLVDNMRAAREQRARKKTRKKTKAR